MSRTTPENTLTTAVIDLLNFYGYVVRKIYNGAIPAGIKNGKVVFRSKKSKKYKAKGVVDIEATYPNRDMIKIEVKILPRKPTPEQREYLDDLVGIPGIKGFVVNQKTWAANELENYLKEMKDNG